MNAMNFLYRILGHIDDEKYRKVVEFVFLWQDYNYWYNYKNPDIVNENNGMPYDRTQALLLAEDNNAVEVYNTVKGKFLRDFKAIPANNKRADWERDRLLKTGLYQKEKKYNDQHCSLKDFLDLVYQIRCNFIHGSKEGDDVDIALIGWARDSLGELLDKLKYMQE